MPKKMQSKLNALLSENGKLGLEYLLHFYSKQGATY
jgi:hypothetical protein